MPVKRRTPKAREHKITPESVIAWRRGCEILEAGGDEKWEAQGGNRWEFLECINTLRRQLGLPIYGASPLETIGCSAPPANMNGGLPLAAWWLAAEMRDELEKALRASAKQAGGPDAS